MALARVVIVVLPLVHAVIGSAVSRADEPIDFNRDIRPILSDACFHCHGPDKATQEANLRLDVQAGAFTPIKGRFPVVAGSPDKSEVIKRITHADPDERMPPIDSGRKLSKQQIATLTRWVAEGAKWQKHWSFVPPRRPALPAVNNKAWVKNPIDTFVLAKLEREELSPSSEADRLMLIRRVTLDLTGLPPTIEEIDAFVNDRSADAYEQLVDRLLASTRFGEHMATSWLDAARYADTNGYQGDKTRTMWIWRDWVVRAFNDNMSFDQFTVEQIAGDMLPDATIDQKVATGFNRNHRINSEGGIIPEEYRVEYVADRVETTGAVWLGLTIGCARCHDHKYDPITQKNFYELFAFFNNVPENGMDGTKGNAAPVLTVPLPGGGKTQTMVMAEGKKRQAFILDRGQYDKHGEPVEANTPESLGRMSDDLPKNRLGLARWLVQPSNPLTARVAVNRYWQAYFGVGLIKTSEDFGAQGEWPTHPELLDWLATEFVRTGWDVKAMQKLIVTSATYRQSSRVTEALLELDPDNRLLARGPRVRLTAHQIRDQALAASGLLVETMGGPPVKPYQAPGLWKELAPGDPAFRQSHGEGLYRRSLYTFIKRTITPPTLAVFNASPRETCVVRFDRTNTPLAALTLQNDVQFVEAARHLAHRMIRDGGDGPAQRINYGVRLLLGRPANAAERGLFASGLNRYLQHYKAQPAAAKLLLAVGESKTDATLDPTEHAAYTALAIVIINLDEAITKQ